MKPSDHPQFRELCDGWLQGRLGPDKTEGIGLLRKNGGYESFLVAAYRSAPTTLRALAQLETQPQIGDATLGQFIAAWERPDATARTKALAALDLGSPTGGLHDVLDNLDPPMALLFRDAIEDWLNLAQQIEGDATTSPQASKPAVVTHAKFGRGTVTRREGDKLTIAFDDGTERTLLRRFVTEQPAT